MAGFEERICKRVSEMLFNNVNGYLYFDYVRLEEDINDINKIFEFP